MDKLLTGIRVYFDWFYLPTPTISDVLEIILLSFVIYYIMLWFKRTRAWTLFKGIIMLLLVFAISYLLKMNTILWIFRNAINVGIIAIIILFQPELRRALEELGRRSLIYDVFMRDDGDDKHSRISEATISEIVGAAMDMSKAKTGALIVIERDVALGEYESTGIGVDAVCTKPLLVNIFEKNTPLHDGAVIVRNNRVVSATCYLPLTGRKDLNKDLGTRHRAALGISEVSDSLTVVVSEENGNISVASGGNLHTNLNSESLRKHLESLKSPKSSKSLRQTSERGKKLRDGKTKKNGGVKNENQNF